MSGKGYSENEFRVLRVSNTQNLKGDLDVNFSNTLLCQTPDDFTRQLEVS